MYIGCQMKRKKKNTIVLLWDSLFALYIHYFSFRFYKFENTLIDLYLSERYCGKETMKSHYLHTRTQAHIDMSRKRKIIYTHSNVWSVKNRLDWKVKIKNKLKYGIERKHEWFFCLNKENLWYCIQKKNMGKNVWNNNGYIIVIGNRF